MENQHEKILGYRDLDENEIAAMNAVKELGIKLGMLVENLQTKDAFTDDAHFPDQRWVNIGNTDLQKGIMALVRSIAKPTTF